MKAYTTLKIISLKFIYSFLHNHILSDRMNFRSMFQFIDTQFHSFHIPNMTKFNKLHWHNHSPFIFIQSLELASNNGFGVFKLCDFQEK